MFTGIIYHTGKFLSLYKKGDFYNINVEIELNFQPRIGESIALDGVCLTLTNFTKNIYTFDLSQETLNRTTLRMKKAGDLINVEPSLRVGDDISGHFVYGHVDTTGKLINIYKYPSNVIFRFQVKNYPHYLIEKGSIAINGVSLTISKVISKELFEIAVIPETLKKTNLSLLKNGDVVNIEFDMFLKYIHGVLQNVKYH